MTEGTSPLDGALRQFEATEANLGKLERLWAEIEKRTPGGIEFGSDPVYDQLCREYADVLAALPSIDGWRPESQPQERDAIAQDRLDAQEIGEVEALVAVKRSIEAPGRDLKEYRHRFNKKRRELVRRAILDLVDGADRLIVALAPLLKGAKDMDPVLERAEGTWKDLRDAIAQIDRLLGSAMERPPRWSDLRRHLGFGQAQDLRDIVERDWPAVRNGLTAILYAQNDPVPVAVSDLGELTATKPSGPVATKLRWEALDEEGFERLIYSLISGAPGYENAQWLTKTRAPDGGRDLSVDRVVQDQLSGTIRLRVIIQCRHWTSRSVSVGDVAALKEQMRLWEPPRVDVLVVATSGRFGKDAVKVIETHNQSDAALRIEMWPESHLERLLAAHPGLVAEFGLR